MNAADPEPAVEPVAEITPEPAAEPEPEGIPEPAAEPEPEAVSGMESLREYYFDFARQYRLDYVPFFERYLLPWDSTEYLFWAFAINLDHWGDKVGTMTKEYDVPSS